MLPISSNSKYDFRVEISWLFERQSEAGGKGGNKLKKCSEDTAVFLFNCCDSNHNLEVALPQSGTKVNQFSLCIAFVLSSFIYSNYF